MPVGKPIGDGDIGDVDALSDRLQSNLNGYIKHPLSNAVGGRGVRGSARGTPPGHRGGMLARNLSPEKRGDLEMGSVNSDSGSDRAGGGRGPGRLLRGISDMDGHHSSRLYSMGSSEAFDVEDANQRIAPPKVRRSIYGKMERFVFSRFFRGVRCLLLRVLKTGFCGYFVCFCFW